MNFFAVKPEVVVCDLHPDYASTREAESLAARWGVPLVRVQHHHAHAAAAMAEHDLEGPVLALAWDGTGYGGDGTIWGGEALQCEGAEFCAWPNCALFPCPAEIKRCTNPAVRPWDCCTKFSAKRPGDLPGIWFKPENRPH